LRLSKESKELKAAIINDYGLNDKAALAILQTALEARDLMKKAQRLVNKEGLTTKGDRGQIKSHPLLATIRDARAQFLAGIKQLNLDIAPVHDRPGRPGGR